MAQQHRAVPLSEAQQSTYQGLLAMGFTDSNSRDAAQVFGANIQGAIDYVIQSSAQTNNAAKPSLHESMPPPPPRPVKFPEPPSPDSTGTFRITKLSKLLIQGYIRSEGIGDIPDDIQQQIVKSTNLLLVKLNYNLHDDVNLAAMDGALHTEEKEGDDTETDGDTEKPEVIPIYSEVKSSAMAQFMKRNVPFSHTGDTNMPKIMSLHSEVKLSAMAQFLERNGPFKYVRIPAHSDIFSFKNVRIWLRFEMVKEIYAFHGTKRTKPITVEDIMAIEGDPERWVEIPDDYMKMTVSALERVDEGGKLSNLHKELLEIGVEFYDPVICEWPSWNTVDSAITSTETDEESADVDNEHHWTSKLKVGDIVDAKDDQDKWYESVIRYIDGPEEDRKLLIHYIGWNLKWDEFLSALDSTRIQKRGTHSHGPHRHKRKGRLLY